MATGVSQDTIWINRSRGQFRLVQRTGQQAQQPTAGNPVPVVQQNSGNRFDQVELNRLNKAHPELKGLITGDTAVNGINIYKAETSFSNNNLITHYFIFKDDKFVEVNANGSAKADGKTYTPAELKNAIDNAKTFQAYTTNRTNNSPDVIQLKEDLYGSGDYVAVNSALSSLNKNNILDFLTEYYSVTNYKGQSFCGLLESVDCRDGITMNSKKNVVKALLDAADALGMSNSDAYIEVSRIYKMYASGRYKNSTNMVGNSDYGSSSDRHTPKGYWQTVGASTGAGATIGSAIGVWFCGVGIVPGALVGGLIGFFGGALGEDIMQATETGHYEPRDSAKLDRAMYKLVQEMNARLNQQCINRVTTPARRTMGVYEA